LVQVWRRTLRNSPKSIPCEIFLDIAAILNFGSHLEKWWKIDILAKFTSKPLQYICFLKSNWKWKRSETFLDMAAIFNFAAILKNGEKSLITLILHQNPYNIYIFWKVIENGSELRYFLIWPPTQVLIRWKLTNSKFSNIGSMGHNFIALMPGIEFKLPWPAES